tara:strand:- start:803 stop:1345 length:543 start_codon:yes stop_codon:yes gene_type:complete
MTNLNLKKIVRTIPDYPIPGIQFRDITSITENATAFKQSITELSVDVAKFNADCIVGIESRGFVFGTPIATKFDLPFILARKPSKLPNPTVSKSFKLEYGETELHIQKISPIQGKVAIVDDLVATGGTALACADLIHEHWNIPKENILIVAVIDLPNLGGSAIIKEQGYDVKCIMEFEGE